MSAIIIFTLRVFATASLYAFLGFIILILWKDLKEVDKNTGGSLQTPIIIKDISTDEIQDFSDNEIFIGRDPLAQIRLQHDESVSNIHARIFRKEENWWVEDLQSTNGTFLNEDPIVTPTIIVTGDQITCGKTTIEISINNNPSPTEI
jgi:pSer/pThr/pTyr-binding forkhead associated (FHA) protein